MLGGKSKSHRGSAVRTPRPIGHDSKPRTVVRWIFWPDSNGVSELYWLYCRQSASSRKEPTVPADPNPPPPSQRYRADFPSAGFSGELSTGTKPGPKSDSPPQLSGVLGEPKLLAKSRAADIWALVGCNAIVFMASLCIMVLELTASRLIASYVGQSLYTWTSVIGVVLAGISIGNYVGGWLADRYPPRKVLAWLFLASGLLTFSVLLFNNMAANMAAEKQIAEGMSWQLWVMLIVAWVFFLPALSLGTISPVTASMALKRSAKTGITVGNIYAWGALGSIVGTFLTGFWLFGEFGSRSVIWMISGILVVMAALVAGGQRVFRAVALIGALQLILHYGMLSSATAEQISSVFRTLAGIRSGWTTAPADFEADEQALVAAENDRDEAAQAAARTRIDWRRERKAAEDDWARWGERLGGQMHGLGLALALRRDNPAHYHDESDYFAINISERRSGDDVVKVLTLDHLIHSYYDPRHPAKLYYDYERIYAAVTERAAGLWDKLTRVNLSALPEGGDVTAAFASSVRYDESRNCLSLTGTMDFSQLRRLLSTGPYADFSQAMFSAWEQANGDWNLAPRRIGAIIAVPLPRLPVGISFPPDLAARVHYDRVLKSIVCTAPFDFNDLLRLLAQGEMQEYVEAVHELYYSSRHTSTLFIGGGGYIFPRWIEANFPNEPLIDVAEIDPAVKTAAERQLGLAAEYGPPALGKTYVRTHVGDARKFVAGQLRANARRAAEGQAPVTYDFIYGDAFNDLSVPWHLTTLEFSSNVARLLTPGEGVYLVNLIDIYPRAEYPRKSEKVGIAEIGFSGDVPRSLLPETIPAGKYVSCRGEFKALKVAKHKNVYHFRVKGAMSKATRDALKKLAGEVGSHSDGDSGFPALAAELYARSNARILLAEEPPPALKPQSSLDRVWQNVRGPFQGLQVCQFGDEGFLLGFRGVMGDQTRAELLEVASGNEKLTKAVQSLYDASHTEKCGRFLGRYLLTAKRVFPYVYVFTSNKDAPKGSRDTFVVVCSLKKLDFQNLEESGGHWKNGPFAWAEPESQDDPHLFGEMPALLQLAGGKLLTDDFAPVDNLLAQVPVAPNRDEDD